MSIVSFCDIKISIGIFNKFYYGVDIVCFSVSDNNSCKAGFSDINIFPKAQMNRLIETKVRKFR